MCFKQGPRVGISPTLTSESGMELEELGSREGNGPDEDEDEAAGLAPEEDDDARSVDTDMGLIRRVGHEGWV